MFDFFNQISAMLSGQIHNLAYGFEHIPVAFAFFLGIVGAVAPCQITSNISAITIYGNKSLIDRVPWIHVCLFILGKVVVFSVLGIIIWMLGKEIHGLLSSFFPVIRKLIGPLLIVVGLFMLGWLRFSKTVRVINVSKKWKDSYLGSFLLGVSFTLAFCPTMFVLFFLTLMPIVVTTSYGILLPAVFGIGTSLPLLLIIFLLWYFGGSGVILKGSRKMGLIIQKVAGGLILVIGIVDMVIYW